MDFIVEHENKEHSKVTVKYLINKLLDCDMDDYVIIKDSDNKQLHNVKISVRKQTDRLGCFFG